MKRRYKPHKNGQRKRTNDIKKKELETINYLENGVLPG